MGTQRYSSYAQIEHDLEILKTERELHYQKIKLSIDKTKESLMPSKAISVAGEIYEKAFTGTYATIIKILIPYAIKWFRNRKRGD